MVKIEIPEHDSLRISNLVLDFNGTIAFDGRIVPGVAERLESLSERLAIHVLTGDTFGSAQSELENVPCNVAVPPPGKQDEGKMLYVERLGPESVAAVGNGRIDRLMLKASALGIAVVQEEGAAVETIMSADIVVRDILSALDLLANPLRITATLR